MVKLYFAIVASGPLRGRKFLVNSDSKVLIGRAEEAAIKLDTDNFCSRKHAMLYWVGENCFIEDLTSTNGTFVNKKRVTGKVEVKNKDVIHLGNTDIIIAEFKK